MSVLPPCLQELLIPLLASLPAAAISSEPPTSLLPFFSPILRQRIQILSSLSSDPWISLLCYNEDSVVKLKASVSTSQLDPHPASGQVELDWENESQVQFKRIDAETLQALVVLQTFNLVVKLVWCTNDAAGIGSSNGWRIGELEPYKPEHLAWGTQSLTSAEELFRLVQDREDVNLSKVLVTQAVEVQPESDEDIYWAQYEQLSPQTSTAQAVVGSQKSTPPESPIQDEAYYARYAAIQPALDKDDPTEAHVFGITEDTLFSTNSSNRSQLSRLGDLCRTYKSDESHTLAMADSLIPHTTLPFQQSRRGSNISLQRKSTFGELSQPTCLRPDIRNAVKLHISTSLKSLFRLACATELEEEFEHLVRSELDALNKNRDAAAYA